MNNKKSILTAIVLSVLLLNTFLIAAQEEITITDEDKEFNFLSWFKNTFNIQDFSTVGDLRGCDDVPVKTLDYYKGDEMRPYQDIAEYCDSGFGIADVFYSNWDPVNEYSSEQRLLINVESDHLIEEIYCCPHPECESDLECEGWYGEGSECLTADEDPDINWYPSDTFNYCSTDVSVDCWYESGDTCISRTYNDQTECSDSYGGVLLYDTQSECLNNIGGGEEDGTGEDGIGDSEEIVSPESAEILGASVSKEIADQGEMVTFTVKIKNNADSQKTYLLEGGIIPPTTAEEWGFPVEQMESLEANTWGEIAWDLNSNIFKFGGLFNNLFATIDQGSGAQCCDGQENIQDASVTLQSGESTTVDLTLTVPYEGIEDKCMDNDYWAGTGDYVAYTYLTTGCWDDEDRVFQDLTARWISISGEEVEKKETLTWTEFYSLSDEDYTDEVSRCNSDIECTDIEGYDVSCVENKEISERNFEITRDACDENLGGLDDIIDIIGKISLVLPSGVCDKIAQSWEDSKDLFVGNKYCVAEANTWYGELWESTLKMVGGMGIPYQYVIISTIAFMAMLALLIVRMIT